jgi:hypothetical protein
MYCVQFKDKDDGRINLLFRTGRSAKRHLQRVRHLSPRLGVRDGWPLLGESPKLQFYAEVFPPGDEQIPDAGWYVYSPDYLE